MASIPKAKGTKAMILGTLDVQVYVRITSGLTMSTEHPSSADEPFYFGIALGSKSVMIIYPDPLGIKSNVTHWASNGFPTRYLLRLL